MVTQAQTLSTSVLNFLDDETPPKKKEKIEEHVQHAKVHLKSLIPIAKAVGSQPAGQEKSTDLADLKREIKELTDSCELMVNTLRLEG